MLGIEYDVNLHDMIKLNYDKKLVKIKAIIKSWDRRTTTPLGRNTIFKSLIISQLNHLFLSLPNPSDTIIKEINSIMYNFIWNSGIDKIKRNVCIQNYRDGGFKTTEINSYINALKTSWIRRYLHGKGKWKIMFQNKFNFSNMLNFGSDYLLQTATTCTNPFWIDTIQAWRSIVDTFNKKMKNTNIQVEPLWYNPMFKINSETIINNNLHSKGIYYVQHLLDGNGKFLDVNVFNELFHTNINFLNYLSLIRAIKSSYIFKETK